MFRRRSARGPRFAKAGNDEVFSKRRTEFPGSGNSHAQVALAVGKEAQVWLVLWVVGRLLTFYRKRKAQSGKRTMKCGQGKWRKPSLPLFLSGKLTGPESGMRRMKIFSVLFRSTYVDMG